MQGGFEFSCWPRFVYDLIDDKEDVEVIAFYRGATTVSYKSVSPIAEDDVYKAALLSEPDIVIILLGLNDSKVGNYDKKMFKSEYKRIINDF